MSDRFGNIEKQLKNFIEGQTARILASLPVEDHLAHRFVETMQENSEEIQGLGFFAPSEFALRVHPNYFNDVYANQELLHELAGVLENAARENGLELKRAAAISVVPDGDIKAGEFEVTAYPIGGHDDETGAITTDLATDLSQVPMKAFMIVKGEAVYPLEDDVINIGRGHDNKLIIEDGRVSRQHAQLRAVNGYFLLCDLDSTGGTFLNGESVSQAVIHPGDVISLAGLTLVYGEDAVRTLEETQEFHPESGEDPSAAAEEINGSS